MPTEIQEIRAACYVAFLVYTGQEGCLSFDRIQEILNEVFLEDHPDANQELDELIRLSGIRAQDNDND